MNHYAVRVTPKGIEALHADSADRITPKGREALHSDAVDRITIAAKRIAQARDLALNGGDARLVRQLVRHTLDELGTVAQTFEALDEAKLLRRAPAPATDGMRIRSHGGK